MPKSKRSRKIPLTQTAKKGREKKDEVIQTIHDYADTFKYIYLIRVDNMRNSKLKDIREAAKEHSRLVFGKNSIMQIALGSTKENEYKPGLFQLAKAVSGECGLMFSNLQPSAIDDMLASNSDYDYARSGAIANDTVSVDNDALKEFPHNMEPQLRKLGLNTTLKNGTITIPDEHTICKKGEVLNPEQARLLKLFGIQMAEFKVNIAGHYHKEKYVSNK
eukprot:GFYU01001395.1.p1 GENE.GFYU01001395.1~~GFYU01001395.1.p1  ORF type:complete len:219 (-),score=90.15 GFYU01001395.1:187-843(-)